MAFGSLYFGFNSSMKKSLLKYQGSMKMPRQLAPTYFVIIMSCLAILVGWNTITSKSSPFKDEEKDAQLDGMGPSEHRRMGGWENGRDGRDVTMGGMCGREDARRRTDAQKVSLHRASWWGSRPLLCTTGFTDLSER